MVSMNRDYHITVCFLNTGSNFIDTGDVEINYHIIICFLNTGSNFISVGDV